LSRDVSYELLDNGVGFGEDVPSDWEPIGNTNLLILVGVTGVGKTTTVKAIRDTGLDFKLLPNRRVLADRILIPTVQQVDNLPFEDITDRVERFNMTARYRELHPGGTAHALSLLHVEDVNKHYLFDGLRGANECQHAVELMPEAKFIVLDAPAIARLQRLLGRSDAFDKVDIDHQQSPEHGITRVSLGMDDTDDLFTEGQQAELIRTVQRGEVTSEQMKAKLAIVKEERRNYNPDDAIEVLLRYASLRTLVIDTVMNSPQQAAAAIVDFARA